MRSGMDVGSESEGCVIKFLKPKGRLELWLCCFGWFRVGEKWCLDVNLEEELWRISVVTVWHCSTEPKIKNGDKKKLCDKCFALIKS